MGLCFAEYQDRSAVPWNEVGLCGPQKRPPWPFLFFLTAKQLLSQGSTFISYLNKMVDLLDPYPDLFQDPRWSSMETPAHHLII